MNTIPKQTNIQVNARINNPVAAATASLDDMLLESPIEFCTITAYMRRIAHRWNLEDIERFGTKVGRVAEAAHLAYLTTMDAVVGPVRVFPLPFLQRVYDIQRMNFGWPAEAAAPSLPESLDAERATLKAHERLVRLLRAAADAAPDETVQQSGETILTWLESEIVRLRALLGIDEPTTAPSR
jgi:hypothetical protein